MAENQLVVDVPLSQIRDFLHHPYLVKEDESMDELVDSIKERGLIQPVLIRPVEDGMYEMVSGHRRKRAFEIAGYEKIPARVKEMSRDEAILSMVDSNLQRETVLPSEKARAYKMRLDALRRQVGRPTKNNSDPTGPNLTGTRSNTELAAEVKESETQIKRYIRLNYLVPEMLDLVDEGKVAMRPAVEISYLPEEIQYDLLEAMEYNEATPSHDQTIDTNTYGQSKGKNGNYSTNYQVSGRELLTPDEVRLLDNKYALLFVRGERPIKDLKYDILKHPNVDKTADGTGKPYVHGFNDYSLEDIDYTVFSKNDKDDEQPQQINLSIYSKEEIEEYLNI